jgi:hypothetical protein
LSGASDPAREAEIVSAAPAMRTSLRNENQSVELQVPFG